MFKNANYKGQTLVIILLGTSVALTVALAVSVRTISTLKQTTTSSQAQQSLAAAEAGAEVALGHLKDGSCTGSEAVCSVAEASAFPLSSSNTSYWYTTTKTGGSGSQPYILDLAKDNTQEVKLAGGSGLSSVRLCWWDPTLDGTTELDNAVEIIYVEGVSPYTMKKYAYNGRLTGPTNGFANAGGQGSVTINGKLVSYNHCQSIPDAGAMSSPQILRVKAFYSSFSAVIDPGTGTLPAQGFQILSYGKTADGSVKKAVRVTKSLPSLPGIFDFAIYSGSSTQPLSK